MLQQAKAKLQAEIDANKTNQYVQVVGEFLLQHLETNPKDADKILVTDKSIGKSLDEMKKSAEKKKFGNCAVLTDYEGFTVVLKYFGIDTKVDKSVIKTAENVIKPTKNVTAANDFDIKLEDLLL